MYIESKAKVSDASMQMAVPALCAPLPKGIRKGRKPKGFYSKMSEDVIEVFATEFLRKNWITRRGELLKAVLGVYLALRQRKLLDAVFTRIRASRHADSRYAVIDALESFGDGE